MAVETPCIYSPGRYSKYVSSVSKMLSIRLEDKYFYNKPQTYPKGIIQLGSRAICTHVLIGLRSSVFLKRYYMYGLCIITKTCLYNFDPLKPHFYIVILGFTGVYIIFLISAQKHRLWVLVGTASSRWF